MKVILNKDLATLGEEGDVKDVAKGYARNYLFPRGIALPFNEKTQKLFESRRGEIEERKSLKRQDAAGLKEKLEALSMVLVMPAGQNGKLYGAVTTQTIVEELARNGFQVERKKIEIPGNTIKSVGKYKITVKLYENAAAECSVSIEGQPVKTETKTPSAPARRGRRDHQRMETPQAEEAQSADAAAETAAGEATAAETFAAETSVAETTDAPVTETAPSAAEDSAGSSVPV